VTDGEGGSEWPQRLNGDAGAPRPTEELLHPARRLRRALAGADREPEATVRPAAGLAAAEDPDGAPTFLVHGSARPEFRLSRVPRWGWLAVPVAILAVLAATFLPRLARPAPTVAALPRVSAAPSPSPPPTVPADEGAAIVTLPGAISGRSTGTTVAIGDLRMFNQSDGWAQRLDDGDILHTTEGARRWIVATPPTAERVLAVAFIDSVTASVLTAPVVSAHDVVIQTWSTGDSGATWNPQGTILVGVLSSADWGGLIFANPEQGWFSLHAGVSGLGIVVYHTADGGAHWVEVARTTTMAWRSGAAGFATAART